MFTSLLNESNRKENYKRWKIIKLPELSLVVFLGARSIWIVIPVFVRVSKVHVQTNMHDFPEFVLHVSEIPCGEAFRNKKDRKMDENDADESHERFLQIHPCVQVDLWWGWIVWVLGIVPTVKRTPFDFLLKTMEIYYIWAFYDILFGIETSWFIGDLLPIEMVQNAKESKAWYEICDQG